MADGEDSAPQGRVKASVGCGSDHTLKDPHMMGDPTGKRGAPLHQEAADPECGAGKDPGRAR